MKDIPIVIPSYEPDERLIQLCENLYKEKLRDIIVINDGSSPKYDYIFKEIEKKYNCTILKHCINLGKGRGLKTAFNYLLATRKSILGCITVDSDGQHLVKDIKKCMSTFREHPDSLILGCRDFKSDNVPAKSKFGNNITKKVFKIFLGIKISDTQTGLRVIPKEFMRELIGVSGERFEYETNMLVEGKDKYPIVEVEIDTVYDSKENHSSHFNPIVDSFKIYRNIFKVFIKYIFSSASSFVIDIVLFSIFILIFDSFKEYILIATILARIISSAYNYLLNHKFVFKSNKNKKQTVFKYYILVIIQMFLSGTLVTYFVTKTMLNETFVKVCVDVILFFLSFFVQRKFIFSNKGCK